MTEKVQAFDYTRKRTKKEAFLFYVASIIFGVVLASGVKALFALIFGEAVPKYFYVYLIYAVGTIYTFAIAARVMYTKRLWKNSVAVVLAVLAVFSAAPLGLVTGFIPISILMTFEPLEKV